MYMYYLLGYRLLGSNDDSMYSNQSDVGKTNRAETSLHANITQRSKIFRSMNHIQRVQVEHHGEHVPQRERERDRQTDRKRQRQTERQTEIPRETERDRHVILLF